MDHDFVAVIAAGARTLFRLGAILEDLGDLFADILRLGKADRHDRDLILLALDIKQLQDIEDTPDLVAGVADDQSVGRRVGDHRVGRHDP